MFGLLASGHSNSSHSKSRNKTAVYLRQKAEVSGAWGKEEERNGEWELEETNKVRENYF